MILFWILNLKITIANVVNKNILMYRTFYELFNILFNTFREHLLEFYYHITSDDLFKFLL
jgi:hypothetical protein